MTSFNIEMEAQGFPVASENIENNLSNIEFCENDFNYAVKEAQAIVVLTEWDQFSSYDYGSIRKLMKDKATIYDFRCYLDAAMLAQKFDRAF